MIEDFLKCIDEKRYYDAHEVLEEKWHEVKKDDKPKSYIYKGFINASVSFELHKRGKLDASEKIWKVYEKYVPLIESLNPKDKETLIRCKVALEKHKKNFIVF